MDSLTRRWLHTYLVLVTVSGIVTVAGGCRQSDTAEQGGEEFVPIQADRLGTRAVRSEENAVGYDVLAESIDTTRMHESSNSVSASMLPASALPAAAAALSIVQGAAPVQPHLVKTVDIGLQVEDVRAKSAALQGLATELGGYLSQLDETVDPVSRAYIRQTVRIPALRLDEAMTRIEAFGKVLHRTLNTQDVTLQFVDMQSRLRNLEKTESRLLAHLEQSGDMQAILNVEKEIDRVRGEIETAQGRINDLANQIGFATVHVAMTQNPSAGPIAPATAFSTSKTFTDALRNLVHFGRGLWFVTIWIVVWSPVWVPVALLVRFMYRRRNTETSTAQ